MSDEHWRRWLSRPPRPPLIDETVLMPDTVDGAPTASDLAWEATRSGLSVLEPEHRQWFEDAAAFVAHVWPVSPSDEGMPDPEDADDLRTQLAVASTTIERVEALLDVDLDDLEHAEEAIAARLEHERQEGMKDATVPSRANTAERKALRLLVDGRIRIDRVVTGGELDGLVVASCVGASGQTYLLGYDPRSRNWRCTCPELRGRCSHITALQLVTAARPTE